MSEEESVPGSDFPRQESAIIRELSFMPGSGGVLQKGCAGAAETETPWREVANYGEVVHSPIFTVTMIYHPKGSP